VIVQLSDDAEIDLLVAVAFYEKHGTHVGDLFLVSISKDIKSLEHTGGIHSLRFGYHCMSSNKFPFAIYYFMDQEQVNVVAILDERQDPESISRRLSGEE
jgi:hypothetical protein